LSIFSKIRLKYQQFLYFVIHNIWKSCNIIPKQVNWGQGRFLLFYFSAILMLAIYIFRFYVSVGEYLKTVKIAIGELYIQILCKHRRISKDS